MGCCPSHPATSPYDSADRSHPLPPHDDIKETVKEVLTETQPLPSKTPVFDTNHLVRDSVLSLQTKLLASNKDSKSKSRIPLLPDDVSEDRASEICSRSESFVSTVDDNSPSGALLKIVSSKSESRRSNSSRNCSPGKRPPSRTQTLGYVSASASGRKKVRRTQEQSPGRREVARSVGGPKEDLGERSARRSRSPATRVGRTESGRKADPSPGRSRRPNVAKRVELIENPLVSLECFIFL